MSALRTLPNPLAATREDLGRTSRAPLDFDRRLPDYAVTPLLDAPGLADSLGVGKVWVKDESWRLGLPAFKILGASWAVYKALEARFGAVGKWENLDELKERLAPLLPLTLAAATDGNHGRAVARMAKLLGPRPASSCRPTWWRRAWRPSSPRGPRSRWSAAPTTRPSPARRRPCEPARPHGGRWGTDEGDARRNRRDPRVALQLRGRDRSRVLQTDRLRRRGGAPGLST